MLSGISWKFGALLVLLTASASGQLQPPEARQQNRGKFRFEGTLDGYWSYNGNHPGPSANNQQNGLYNFNDRANQLNLAMAELDTSYVNGPLGATADLIFGRANTLIQDASDRSGLNYVEQAFVSFKPDRYHGAELDLGQFVTSAGVEVIDARDDWNYSRSLLFSWAIPYYHFGMRTSFPLSPDWTAGLQIVNGWNDITKDNGGITCGLTSAFTRQKYSWDVNYYTGPERTNNRQGSRNLIDSTLMLTPSPKFKTYLNYDYGQDRIAGVSSYSAWSPHWQGIAIAARQQLPGKSAVAARYEYFDDNQGFTTGRPQALREITTTYEYRWTHGLISRLEYRRDWSDVDFFRKGESGSARTQSTVTAALIAYFGDDH